MLKPRNHILRLNRLHWLVERLDLVHALSDKRTHPLEKFD